MPHLSLVHRLTAVLSSALLLQLSLLSSGAPCPMHGHDLAEHGSSHMGMTHVGMAAATVMGTGESPVPNGRCDMNGSGRPCDSPWSSNGCAAMATCVVAVAASPAVMQLATHSFATASPRAPLASVPLGPSFAPELPPPRV